MGIILSLQQIKIIMAPHQEMFCLRWEDYQQNLTLSISELYGKTDFSNVTIVSEGDEHINAAQFILTCACPVFFKNAS